MYRKRRSTSIKPGRGPSFMGGIGSVIAVVFGIFWMLIAFQITKDSPFGGVTTIFPLFGVLFILMGVANAVYSFKNATAEKRYSLLDITDSETEPDPLNERFGVDPRHPKADNGGESLLDQAGLTSVDVEGRGQRRFCPYCGQELDSNFRFCPSCGKELP